MEKTKEQINQELVERINSNRNNKTRIVFEMQDKDDGNVTYKFTLGNLFDIAFEMGKKSVEARKSALNSDGGKNGKTK